MDVNFQFDWSAAFGSIPYLLPGIPWTLLISFGGLAIGFFIGIFFGYGINGVWIYWAIVGTSETLVFIGIWQREKWMGIQV